MKNWLNSNWVFIFPAATILIAFALLALYARWLPSFNHVLHRIFNFREAPAWGQLGDFWGGLLNPLVALSTLIVAVLVWKQQREELQETKKALEAQANTTEQQRREQRFFDLLNIYLRTLEGIQYTRQMTADTPYITWKGKEALSMWFDTEGGGIKALRQYEEQTTVNKNLEPDSSDDVTIVSLFAAWDNRKNNDMLDHYFRMVFRVLSDAEVMLGDSHFHYIKIFRAQLSAHELKALAWNCWLDPEGKNMRPYVEKYGLLKHLRKGKLRSTLEKVLDNSAFGKKPI
jgi:hypothetical protein